MKKLIYANFRAKREDIALLKEVAAIRRESMIEVLGLLIRQEYERLQAERNKHIK